MPTRAQPLAGYIRLFEPSTNETIDVQSPIKLVQDFHDIAGVNPGTSAALASPFVAAVVANGSVATVADFRHGAVALALTNANEAQSALLVR